MAPHPPHAPREPACLRAVKPLSLSLSLPLACLLSFDTSAISKQRRRKKVLSSPTPTHARGSLFGNSQRKRLLPAMPHKDDLPISQAQPKDTHLIGLRKRISSFSVKIQPLSSASAEWAIRRSKSLPSLAAAGCGPLRRWWNWGWDWVLSRKPAFAQDLEMNEEETVMLGRLSRGNWRHIFYKVRSEFRKLVQSHSLPTTQGFKYDSFSYAQNFCDGRSVEQ